MTQLRRKHLSDGTYFIWRCEHNKSGTQDRASDRNDGPNQGECEVELCDPPDYAHIRAVARIELAEAMGEFHAAVERVESRLMEVIAALRKGQAT